jgi:predicted 2-oxoglutarate/Fe(II)-dependent dioxygenase YbiX
MNKVETGSKTIFRFDNVLDKATCDILYSEVIKTKNNNAVKDLPWFDGECLEVHQLNTELQKLVTDHRANVTNLINKEFSYLFGELYPEFTHLVLWTPGRFMNRHLDNGYSETDKLRSRKVSSITYLNDDFDGGVTYIRTETGHDYMSKPKLGSVVFFLSGAENMHGVTMLKNNMRVTLPIWFCSDKEKSELNI